MSRDAETKHAFMWLTLPKPSALVQGLQPGGMPVTNGSRAGSSYRSGATFSGQGRLKDILVWNKAQGLVNLRHTLPG